MISRTHAPLNIKVVKKTDQIKLGSFEVEFFHVNHTIPGSVGLAIRTPIGTIVHTGDFKFDHSPVIDAPADIAHIARIGARGILALMSDSTDSQTEGYSISEGSIGKTIAEIINSFAEQASINSGESEEEISNPETIENPPDDQNQSMVLGASTEKEDRPVTETTQKRWYVKVLENTNLFINKIISWFL